MDLVDGVDFLSHVDTAGSPEARMGRLRDVLAQLARNMGPDNFAAFMTSYSLTDILRVLWTAPMKPFLLAWFGLYRWI